MHISTFSMHISTPTEQGAKFGVCDTPVMASVESSLMMADTTPCDSANENRAIHWGECMICQKVTREELRCPSNGSRFDAAAGCSLRSIRWSISRTETVIGTKQAPFHDFSGSCWPKTAPMCFCYLSHT